MRTRLVAGLTIALLVAAVTGLLGQAAPPPQARPQTPPPAAQAPAPPAKADPVFAALDEITRLALNDDLLRLWERHRPTILFVTHSVFESVYLSTRIAVITARPGRIVADLPVERYLAAAQRVNDDAGAVGRVPDLKLELYVHGHFAEIGAFYLYITPFPVL